MDFYDDGSVDKKKYINFQISTKSINYCGCNPSYM